MANRRIRLMSPMGWHRKDLTVPQHSSPTHKTAFPTGECRSLANETSQQVFDSLSGSASTTSRRTFLDKDPQPETSKQIFAEDKDESSQNNDSFVVTCPSPSSKVCTAVGTRPRGPSTTQSVLSFSSSPTKHELANENFRFSVSSPGLWEKRLHISCEQRENPRRCRLQLMSSSEEESLMSEMTYLLMKSNKNRRRERVSRIHRRRHLTESSTDSAYEEEYPGPDKKRSSNAICVPLIRIDDWDLLIEQSAQS